MKKIFASVAAATLLGCAAPALAAHAAPTHGSMSIKVVSTSLPHQVSMKDLSRRTLTFTVKVSGVTLDARHIGKAASGSQGHLQVYLDRIPADGHKKADLKQNWLLSTAATSFSFKLPPALFGNKAGKHSIILALARNNNVLYAARPATVTVTVK